MSAGVVMSDACSVECFSLPLAFPSCQLARRVGFFVFDVLSVVDHSIVLRVRGIVTPTII